MRIVTFLFCIADHISVRTIEIDSIKLQDKDFQVVRKLDYGQFGVVRSFVLGKLKPYCCLQIDVVKCRLDARVYVRKTIEKKFVLRAREVRRR